MHMAKGCVLKPARRNECRPTEAAVLAEAALKTVSSSSEKIAPMLGFTAVLAKGSLPPAPDLAPDPPVQGNWWMRAFISEHPWLCAVDEIYLNDNFNFFGLSSIVENYNEALDVIRGHTTEPPPDLQQQSETLYGLIHARFLLTFPGVKEMHPKYEKKIFGTCPRVSCNHERLLPIGLSPNPGEGFVKTYCPCCQEVYETDLELDGACFGPCFPLLYAQMDQNPHPARTEAVPMTYFGVRIGENSPMNRSGLSGL
jgi:hypothetical protein